MSAGNRKFKEKTRNEGGEDREEGEINRENKANCGVCGRKFGIGVSKKLCEFCHHSVCDLHSLGRVFDSSSQSSLRICDHCDHQRIAGPLKHHLQTHISTLKSTKSQLHESIHGQRLTAEALIEEISKVDRAKNSQGKSQGEKLEGIESRISVETMSVGTFRSIGNGVEESLAFSRRQVEQWEVDLEGKMEEKKELEETVGKMKEEIEELERLVEEKYKLAVETANERVVCPNCRPSSTMKASTMVTENWTHSLPPAPPAPSSKSCSLCLLM